MGKTGVLPTCWSTNETQQNFDVVNNMIIMRSTIQSRLNAIPPMALTDLNTFSALYLSFDLRSYTGE